jgi:ankyrin repeat protein
MARSPLQPHRAAQPLSSKLLLDAGVPAKDKPLLFASMTGDMENVKLLLAHGAEPSTALAQAVTFGYPDNRTRFDFRRSADKTD